MIAKLPPLFLVNLKRDEKKLALMCQQLEVLSVPYEITEAVDGNNLSEEYLHQVYDPGKAYYYIGRELGKAEVGCYLSHLKAMQAIVDSNASYGVIIEDDVIIRSDYIPVLQSIQQLSLDWQIIQLGNASNHQKNANWSRKKYNLVNGYRIGSLLPFSAGTQAYLITRKLCQRVLSESYPIFCPIDNRLFDIFLSFSFAYVLEDKQLFEHNLLATSSIQKGRVVASHLSKDQQTKQKSTSNIRQKIKHFLFFELLAYFQRLWIYIRPVPQGAHKLPILLPHQSAKQARKCVLFVFRLLR